MSLQVISYALITSMIVGIARAWELVGGRDTGLSASIAALAGRMRAPGAAADRDLASGPAPGAIPDHGAGGHRPGEPRQ
jgi:hypothetical protein